MLIAGIVPLTSHCQSTKRDSPDGNVLCQPPRSTPEYRHLPVRLVGAGIVIKQDFVCAVKGVSSSWVRIPPNSCRFGW